MVKNGSAGVLFALAGVLPAQGLWIVDADQRAGATHADIPQAVTAAAPGDVILVRYPTTSPGSYTAPTVVKPLTFLGEEVTGYVPRLDGILSISGIGAGETVAVVGLRLDEYGPSASCGIIADNNSGTVTLVDLQLEAKDYVMSGATPSTVEFRLTDCADVLMHDCAIRSTPPGNHLVRSNLRALDCHFSSPARSILVGLSGFNGSHPGGTGLVLEGSVAIVSRCGVFASAGSSSYSCWTSTYSSTSGGTALDIDAASRVEAGPGCLVQGPKHVSTTCFCCTTVSYSPAAIGAGWLVTDPRCDLRGSAQCQHASLQMHETRIGGAYLFELVTIDVASTPNALALLAIGYKSPAPSVTAYGDFWLDPAQAFVIALLPLDAQGHAGLAIPMATSVGFDRILGVQAGMLLPNATITLSRPAFTILRPPTR